MLDPYFLPITIFKLAYDDETVVVDQPPVAESELPEQNNNNQNTQNNINRPKEKDGSWYEKKAHFTQEEFNRALKEDRLKHKQNREELLRQLNDIKENATLTAKQKEDLEGRIEQLQNETMSAQELARKDRDKLQKEWEKEKNKLLQEADRWRLIYNTEKIERELLDAAIDNKALNPAQITAMLKPASKLVEVLKDGKPTGAWETRVTLHDKGEDGNSVTLELPASAAIKRMGDMPEHWNLFNSGANGGMGAYNIPGSTLLKGQKPPKDPIEYKKWRKANLRGTV